MYRSEQSGPSVHALTRQTPGPAANLSHLYVCVVVCRLRLWSSESVSVLVGNTSSLHKVYACSMNSRSLDAASSARSACVRQQSNGVQRTHLVRSVRGRSAATLIEKQQQLQRQPVAAMAAAATGNQRSRWATVIRRASFFQDQFEDVNEDQPPAIEAAPTDTQAADWVFEHPSGVHVCVFGVEHLERQPQIGQHASLNASSMPLRRRLHAIRHALQAGHNRSSTTNPREGEGEHENL
jgi:hypothetical protein